MNSFENEQHLNKLYDDLNDAHSALMNELKNDKEMIKERTITQKLACIDTMRRSVLKYRNISIKERLKGDL